MSWIVKDGIAAYEGFSANDIFVGSTGPGKFPETGMEYGRFSFAPEPGAGGILVFVAPAQLLKDYYTLWQYRWESDKLIVERRVEIWVNEFNKSNEYGYFSKIGNAVFCTKAPTRSRYVCKRVNIIDLLTYVEGKIDAKELNRRSLKLKLAETKQASLEWQIKELEGLLAKSAETVKLVNRDFSHASRWKYMYAETINAVPKWIMWMFVTCSKQKKNREHVMKVYRHRGMI